MHLPGGHACGADQLVDIDRAWTKRYDQLAFVPAIFGQGLRRPMLGGGASSIGGGTGGRPRIGATVSRMSRTEVTRQVALL